MEQSSPRQPVILYRPPGLAETLRQYGERWEIEHMDHRSEWIAVQRETGGDYIRIVGANNLGDLQHKMKQIDCDQPEERETDSRAAATSTPARRPAARPRPATG
jgi:hypothetical protein